MSVGLIDIEEDEPGMVDHPVFFCPFCGTKVQDPDKVRDMFEEPDLRLTGIIEMGGRNRNATNRGFEEAWQARSNLS